MENIFANKTTEELAGSIKALKIISIAIGIVSSLLIAIAIYTYFVKDNNASAISSLVIGISCMSMIFIQILSIKKMKAEIASREL